MTSVADILKREAPTIQTPLKTVQLDGQVVLKIVQHCNKAHPQLVTGQLLGLDVGATLEVTDSFPFPVRVDRGPASRRFAWPLMRPGILPGRPPSCQGALPPACVVPTSLTMQHSHACAARPLGSFPPPPPPSVAPAPVQACTLRAPSLPPPLTHTRAHCARRPR